jgi:hypothetical protein
LQITLSAVALREGGTLSAVAFFNRYSFNERDSAGGSQNALTIFWRRKDNIPDDLRDFKMKSPTFPMTCTIKIGIFKNVTIIPDDLGDF